MKNIVDLFLLTFSSIYVFIAYRLPHGQTKYGAGFMPLTLGILLIILLLIKVIQRYFKLDFNNNQDISIDKLKLLVFFAILLAFYIITLKMVGFIIASIIYLIAAFLMFQVKGLIKILLISTITPLVIFYLFNSLLRVPLP